MSSLIFNQPTFNCRYTYYLVFIVFIFISEKQIKLFLYFMRKLSTITMQPNQIAPNAHSLRGYDNFTNIRTARVHNIQE